MELSHDQLVEFANSGFVVVRGVVPEQAIDIANAEVDRLVDERPPQAGQVGAHFYWLQPDNSQGLFALFNDTPVSELARSLVAPGEVRIAYNQTQVALNIPPNFERSPDNPGGPHIDGYLEGESEPGTFTMLAAVLLSDQETENSGNLWVWPGTHRTFAAYFRGHGPYGLIEAKGHPQIPLPEPRQIVGRRGDVLLAHYLLGHNHGGNYESTDIRRAAYWRILRSGHRKRWQESIQDELFEYDAVRAALAAE